MNELLNTTLGEQAPAAIDFAIKATALLAFAGLATLCLRKSAAALRHLVWFVAVLGTLLLPLMQSGLPAWEVSWIPDWDETIETSTVPVASAPLTAPSMETIPMPPLTADVDPIPATASESVFHPRVWQRRQTAGYVATRFF